MDEYNNKTYQSNLNDDNAIDVEIINTVNENGYENFKNDFIEEKPAKKRNKKFKFLKTFVILILFVFLGGTIFGSGYLSALYFGDSLLPNFVKVENNLANKNMVQISQINPDIPKTSQYTAPVIISENVGPSVVTITSTLKSRYITPFSSSQYFPEGSGSGIIFKLDENNLYVVTNQHVIDGAVKVDVTLIGGDTYEAKILGYDSTMDIAVLAVNLSNISKDVLSKIAVASFGNSDDLKVGELAVAIGSPLGKAFSNSVTVGVISALNRSINISNSDLKLIQTDAAINPGNSGGALVNSDGLVIGINTAKYIDTDVEGMGFAIPINTAAPIIENILKSKDGSDLATQLSDDRPFLGVGISDITQEIYINTGMPFGVYITDVYKNSGAEKAGLKAGDVILAIGNKKVLKSNDLLTLISGYKVNDTITLTIARDNEVLNIDAKLYKYSDIMK